LTVPNLPLADMHLRHPGLTQAMARMFYEAASVCLSRHHSRPTKIKIDRGGAENEAEVDWLPNSGSLQAAYANTIDTTENGAYGVALAAIEFTAELVAIQRAETLSGADYYVAPKGASYDDFEEALRFEVSGTDLGGRSQCDNRLATKIEQTKAANHSMPAIAGVVGFSQRLVLLSEQIAP
jgi:hypothetical protein